MTDHLKDCPMGTCPWCRNQLWWDGDTISTVSCLHCFKYVDGLSESANRARYLRERDAEEAGRMI